MKRRLWLVAGLLCVLLFPVVARAEGEPAGAVADEEPLGATTYAPVTPLKGTPSYNWNMQDHPDQTATDGTTWTADSYLTETSRGLMRVDLIGSNVIVEYYNASGAVTERKSIAVGDGLCGGFFAGADGTFYLAFGVGWVYPPGTSEGSVRVEHYSSSWEKIGTCPIADGTTIFNSFVVTSLRMAEANGILYVDTGHFANNGPKSHLYAIDESTMTLLDKVEEGLYCNQFLRTDANTLYRVTQAAYHMPQLRTIPLSGSLDNQGTPRYFSAVDEDGFEVMGIDTPSVGGFELSSSGYLVAWSADEYDAAWGRNVHVAYLPREEGPVSTHRITGFKKNSARRACTPQLVKLDDDNFLLMWAEEENNTYRMGLARIDGEGNLTTGITYKNLPASACQPILLASGQVAWYVSTYNEVVLYTLDPWNLAEAPEDNPDSVLYPRWKRVAGGDRYGTMEAIVKQSRPKKSASTILLATGANYADALTSSALAGALDAPLVTTKPGSLSPQAKRAIEYASNGNATVLVIGGPAAVSNSTVNAVKALSCVKTVRRVAGSNRIGTGLAIYNEGKSRKLWGDTCVVTNAFNYKDALSIGSWAAVARAPLFGTSGGTLNAQQVKAIKAGGFKRVVVLGGDKAVNYAAVKKVLGSSFSYTRLWGANGLATSAKIVNWACGYTKVGGEVAFQPSVKVKLDGMGVATAAGFADALTSVSLLSRTKGALLLVQYVNYGTPSELKVNETTYKNIRSVILPRQRSIQQGYILGGERAVDPEVALMLDGEIYDMYE